MLACGALVPPEGLCGIQMHVAKKEALMITRRHDLASSGLAHDVPELQKFTGAGEVAGITDGDDEEVPALLPPTCVPISCALI
jgi:hypothetical protein